MKLWNTIKILNHRPVPFPPSSPAEYEGCMPERESLASVPQTSLCKTNFSGLILLFFKPRLFIGLLEICIRATVHVGGQRTTWESKCSSIHHGDLRDRTQLPQPWPQAPSPLSRLTSPWSVSSPMKCWLMVPDCVSVRKQQNNTKRIHPEVY